MNIIAKLLGKMIVLCVKAVTSMEKAQKQKRG